MKNTVATPVPQVLTCPFEIQFCSWQADIYPWDQFKLRTPFWRLFYNVEEGGVVEGADGILYLKKHRFYLIPAYYELSTHAEKPFEQFYIHFTFIDSLKVTGTQIYEIPADPVIEAHILEFIQLYKLQEKRSRCEMIAHTVLGHVLLHCPEDFEMKELPVDRRIHLALKYISEHLHEKLDNSMLANYCGLSRNAFVRLFSATLQESPQAFIRRRKIDRACYLLHFSNLSIKEIARELGFADQYCFSKVFVKQRYNSPSRFRRFHTSFKSDYGD